MGQFRLKDNHDFMKRVSDLMTKADELGIFIEYRWCTNKTFIADTRTGKEYELRDTEDGTAITSFPSPLEFKITYREEIIKTETNGK